MQCIVHYVRSLAHSMFHATGPLIVCVVCGKKVMAPLLKLFRCAHRMTFVRSYVAYVSMYRGGGLVCIVRIYCGVGDYYKLHIMLDEICVPTIGRRVNL